MSETTVEESNGCRNSNENECKPLFLLNRTESKESTSVTDSCDSTNTDNSSVLVIGGNYKNHPSSTNGKLPTDLSESERSPTKSILSNGNICTTSRRNSKKSVTFDPEDEVVKKFTEGEIIVDKKNPFKNGLVLDASASNRKVVVKIRKTPENCKNFDENEFVTTEDVLKESKYVKTYIKNPDKYFTYDPAIIARIKFDELKELRDKKPPKRIRFTAHTQERLKELRNKYNPLSQLNTEKTALSPKRIETVTTTTSSRIPTFKKVSKSNYPDLSQIKVKTGTDLETSLFNPDEVTKNAKKFDECVKKLHIGSDDDLEEIDEQLTKSDSSDELKSNDQIDSAVVKNEKKSFTNTVNSREFQEYLDKKGLTLAPKGKLSNGSAKDKTVKKENRRITSPSTKIIIEMEPKKVKKPSVFQRLLPSSIFSSKRKTTPKQPVPTPQTLYTTTNTISSSDDTKTSSNIKRVVLERQSFHGGSMANNTNSSYDLKKQMERCRKSYSGDDRSSSISSALTNAEEFCDEQSNESILGRSSNETISSKTPKSRNSLATTVSKERLQNFQTKSAEVRDGIVKPRVQRASIPISALKPLPNKSLEKNNERQSIPIKRTTTLERQNLVQKRPIVTNVDDTFSQFGRSASMDRHMITKRSSNSSRLSNSLNRSSRNSTISQRSCIITPKNSKEELLENGPKLTSTPIQESDKLKLTQLQPGNLKAPLSPITVNTALEPPANFNVGPEEWAQLREIKEKTDRELFNRIVKNQTKSPVRYRNSENIYERLPQQLQEQHQQQQQQHHQHQQQQQQQQRQLQAQVISPSHQPLYAQLIPEVGFARGSPQRNTVTGVFRNRNVKIVDGNAINLPSDKQIIPIESGIKMTNVQPPRSQSVLDEMMIPQQQQHHHHHHAQQPQQPYYGSVAGTPVIMRRKDNPSLSREEILQRVKDFCRKSMNKTPTKLGSNNQLHKDSTSSTGKTASDISPVSYASVDYHGKPTQKIVAPQVPQRVQSLQMSQASPQTPSTSPIYAHVMKRNSIQSNISDAYDSPQRQPFIRPRTSTVTSDTDSVFLAGNQPQQPSSPARYIVVDSEKLTPAHVMKYRNAMGTEIYGQLLPNPYGFIQLKPSAPQNRTRMDGRTTPLILDRPQSSPIYLNTAQQQSPRYMQQQQPQPQQQQQPQQRQGQSAGSVVYLKVKDQVYRPINSDRYYVPAAAAAKPPPGIRPFPPYESESGSEAGEVQRILQTRIVEEDWQNDKSGRNQSSEQATDDRRRAARREDPRRHTLGGDMLQYGGGQGQQQQRAMDLEAPPVRGYTPVNQGPLFDEDPGIMSEVETASTGFRRGGKQRSSLPVVRTPSKTLERPLGLVFLQYRSETKRALLPNEITSIDTVRALFVRSFPRQLTMAYLEGPNVKIYIHDASKDMFYELEDVRSHLREIRDRSVLRLFESNEVAAPQALPGGPGIPQPLPPPTSSSGHWDQDQSYFSEPEFDSEYQHQHIHKSKGGKPAPYYVGATQTLPRGMYSDRNKNSIGAPAKPLRSYGSRGSMGPPFPYPPDQLYSIPDGYTSSPERGTRAGYEEPYYSQYGTRGTTVTPIIDEEQRCSEGSLSDDQYALYGMKVTGRIPRNANQLYDPTRPEDLHRIRVEHMERQLANLTGLVQKALNQNPQITPQVGAINANYLGVPGQCRGGLDDLDGHSSGSSTSIQDKSVSFEKSVSFSDDIQGVPKSHSPQHAADSKPPKPAIKSSTLPRTSSQERDRLKPPPPPKPLALASTHPNYRPDIALAPEVYNHLRGLQKKAKDLRMEVRTLRRLSQAQAVAVREDIKDAFMRIRATLLASSGTYWGQGDVEKTRLSREEELYKQEVIRLEKDLADLEASVEGLRGEVINRRTRVNMAAVEDMALVLSRASKTVAELKMRFPGLQNGLRNILANEMEKVVREEKFLKDEPDRLESALRRCKKLTGTLVTLKRLASVQEQRLPVNEPINEDPPRSAEISSANKPIPSPRMGSVNVSGGVPPENALDALLDELQTFAKPQSQTGDSRPDDSTSDDSSQTLQNTITTQLSQSSLFPTNDPNAPQNNPAGNLNTNTLPATMSSLRRLHSYPSGSDTDTSPPQPSRPVGKPPVPERNADLLSKVSNKRIPPPPPPRTSSRSPLASPTSPNIPQRLPSVCETDQVGNGNGSGQDGSGNSSGNESGNDHVQRQLALEMRHQELLKKQKMLQEQYARLQQMSKNSIALPPSDILQLKKTGSESNLPQKMGLSMTVTGSMKNLNSDSNVAEKNEKNLANNANPVSSGEETSGKTPSATMAGSGQTTTNKVYETDIL